MIFQTFATLITIASTLVVGQSLTVDDIFRRPVYTRLHGNNEYVSAGPNGSDVVQVNVSTIAAALAGLQPSYICSLIYLEYGNNISSNMSSDFQTVRDAVRKTSPNVKLDVEISINPNPPAGAPVVPSANALSEYMQQVDDQLSVDGWWFDFYSTAQKDHPDWISAAIQYAHSHNQTIGGNVFDNVVPPGSDAVSFVDSPQNGTVYGFGIDDQEVVELHQNTTTALILGHLQSNAQNGNTTESCVYIYDWNTTRRFDYMDYWASQQSQQNFTYMFPVFYPLCPGLIAFDPLTDVLPDTNTTLYDHTKALLNGMNSSGTAVGTPSSSSTQVTPTGHSTSAAARYVSPWTVYVLPLIVSLALHQDRFLVA